MTRQRRVSAAFAFRRAGRFLLMALAGLALPGPAAATPPSHVMWVNHFELLPAQSELMTSQSTATSCHPVSFCHALVIESTTTGDVFADGSGKIVRMAVGAPPGFSITGVRVCYTLSSPASFITQIRLAQLGDPPAGVGIMLDDGTDLTDPGPICVNTKLPPEAFLLGPIDPEMGSVHLSVRLNFGDTSDRIGITGLGLILQKEPNP